MRSDLGEGNCRRDGEGFESLFQEPEALASAEIAAVSVAGFGGMEIDFQGSLGVEAARGWVAVLLLNFDRFIDTDVTLKLAEDLRRSFAHPFEIFAVSPRQWGPAQFL